MLPEQLKGSLTGWSRRVGFMPLGIKPKMKRTPPFIFYMLYYAAVSFYMPFIVLYFQGLGFSGAQIGLLTGMAPLIAMVGAPLWTGLADAKHRHKLIMSLALLAAAVLAIIFPWLKTLVPVLLLVGLFSLFSAPIISFADSATMTMLAGEKEMYGRVRLGGTIGWGLKAPLAGILIQAYGINLAFWGYATLIFLTLIISQKFTFGQSARTVSLRGDIRQMLANHRWVFFLCLAFVGGVAFASINTYLFPYMEELGASRTTMGIALTISTLGELPVLFFANRLLKRFKAYGLFVLGLTITGIRLLLYAVFNFPAGILFFQLLNGMTFPVVWVAGVSYADENSPVDMKATAQGLLGAMLLGFGGALGGLAGGLMLGSFGGRAMYLLIGIIVLVSVGAVTLLDKADRARQARSLI
jgi:PPP family 3-phenylpropionic acid transporter